MEIIMGIDFAGIHSDKTVSFEITFISAITQKNQRYYCWQCLFKDKSMLKKHTKPSGTKCYIGSKGYYKMTRTEA
jgi:hypothetical protein